jgi:hypothetical protein
MMSPLETAMQQAKQWAVGTDGELVAGLFSHSDTAALRQSIEAKVHQSRKFPDTIRVTFNFDRHGAMLWKGAGRGIGGRIGSTWTTKNGVRKRTNPLSLNKLGTGTRTPVNWFAPVLERNLGALSEQVGLVYDERVHTILKTLGT